MYRESWQSASIHNAHLFGELNLPKSHFSQHQSQWGYTSSITSELAHFAVDCLQSWSLLLWDKNYELFFSNQSHRNYLRYFSANFWSLFARSLKYHCDTSWKYHCDTSLKYHCDTSLKYHCDTSLKYHCDTSLKYHCDTRFHIFTFFNYPT